MKKMTGEELNRLARTNIREIREDLGLSQSEMARRMGVEQSYISDIERGRLGTNGKPKGILVSTLAPLAAVLGTTPAALLSTANTRHNPIRRKKIPAGA